jgi:hypothetical protein
MMTPWPIARNPASPRPHPKRAAVPLQYRLELGAAMGLEAGHGLAHD